MDGYSAVWTLGPMVSLDVFFFREFVSIMVNNHFFIIDDKPFNELVGPSQKSFSSRDLLIFPAITDDSCIYVGWTYRINTYCIAWYITPMAFSRVLEYLNKNPPNHSKHKDVNKKYIYIYILRYIKFKMFLIFHHILLWCHKMTENNVMVRLSPIEFHRLLGSPKISTCGKSTFHLLHPHLDWYKKPTIWKDVG